jgi:hypothetical protein
MDFRFTISIEGHGARDVAEENAESLLDAFERTHPDAGAAVGADLETGVLEVTFCATGESLDDAAEKAGMIFVDAAMESILTPAPLVGFEVEVDLTQMQAPPQRPRHTFPLVRRRRGAEAWTMPKLLQTAG